MLRSRPTRQNEVAGAEVLERPGPAHLLRPHYPRSFACTNAVAGLERIFEEAISVGIWRRSPDPCIAEYLRQLSIPHAIDVTERVDAHNPQLEPAMRHLPASPGRERLATDIRNLIDLFAAVTGSRRVGLRFVATHAIMCPRFHIDYISMRLICTWQGAGTEWLEHQAVDRRFLGTGCRGLSDETSGLIRRGAQIHRLRAFDVALLKGERYFGNAARGAVHRSPAPDSSHAWRVMLSLDDTD